MPVTVTVAIPFRNAEATLADAVRSVFAQTFADWEMILLDDGSDDASPALARSIRDTRVRILSDGGHRGLPDRLNQAAREARGAYLARMDADDLMHPDRLARQTGRLDARPDVDVVGSAIYSIDRDGAIRGKRGTDPISPNPVAALRPGFLVHPTVLGRTRWFRDHPYDPVFLRSQDRELWSRTRPESRFDKIPEPLHFYREGPGFSLDAFKESRAFERLVFRRHGRRYAPSLRVAGWILGSYLKEAGAVVLSALRAQDVLIRRRNILLDDRERAQAGSLLDRIRQTPVPGWPSSTPGPSSPPEA